MILPILSLCGASFVIAWLSTYLVRGVSVRVGFVDRPGHRKIHSKPIALGGGVAIFVAFAAPILIGLAALHSQRDAAYTVTMVGASTAEEARRLANEMELRRALHAGVLAQTPMALSFVGACLLLHLMGLWDDRRALGPYSKLVIQLGVTAALLAFNKDLRAVTALGPIPSFILTVLWITAVTNAFNFLDNMDGLSAGVACVCAVAFFIAALSIGQWFVAASLALLIGALLGFLCFNFPPASIFMGDSGSLVVGFILGVLTTRTQYLQTGEDFGAGWYAVFVPVIVLAVPLYDLVVVSVIRLSRGVSPFKGDTNHFSHRLVARGMSKRTAVLCLYLISAATAVGAIILPHAQSGYVAFLVFAQTLLILGVVALLEQHPLPQQPASRMAGDVDLSVAPATLPPPEPQPIGSAGIQA